MPKEKRHSLKKFPAAAGKWLSKEKQRVKVPRAPDVKFTPKRALCSTKTACRNEGSILKFFHGPCLKENEAVSPGDSPFLSKCTAGQSSTSKCTVIPRRLPLQNIQVKSVTNRAPGPVPQLSNTTDTLHSLSFTGFSPIATSTQVGAFPDGIERRGSQSNDSSQEISAEHGGDGNLLLNSSEYDQTLKFTQDSEGNPIFCRLSPAKPKSQQPITCGVRGQSTLSQASSYDQSARFTKDSGENLIFRHLSPIKINSNNGIVGRRTCESTPTQTSDYDLQTSDYDLSMRFIEDSQGNRIFCRLSPTKPKLRHIS